MPPLPPDLRGPVTLALAQAVEEIPGATALRGGTVYEPKWDGFRCAIVRHRGKVRLWSRQGTDLTSRFPDVEIPCAAHVPDETVLDGELVIWHDGHLSFDLLQQRMVNRPAKAPALAAAHPASMLVFDVLALHGEDVRAKPWSERRELLEEAATGWRPPLQVSPATQDEGEARQWFVDYRPAGVEGLVVKAASAPYRPGRRDWLKVKSRVTREVIIGAVTGPIIRPESIVVGLIVNRELVIVGRSVPLNTAQAESLAAVLTPAGPDHPWPPEMASTRFGSSRAKVPMTRVEPTVVAEVAVDSALQSGAFRHPVRFIRHRPDLTVADVHD